jgi:hypothetical protein
VIDPNAKPEVFPVIETTETESVFKYADTASSRAGSRAMTNDSILVQIATWNDFGEGTEIEPTRENGYRDLGIVQDLRRQFLDSQFSCHTNDLTLPTRLYKLRQQYGSGSPVAAELDGIFTNAVSGRLREADSRLKSIEAKSR